MTLCFRIVTNAVFCCFFGHSRGKDLQHRSQNVTLLLCCAASIECKITTANPGNLNLEIPEINGNGVLFLMIFIAFHQIKTSSS